MKKKQQAIVATEDIACSIAALLQPAFFKALCDPNRIDMLVRLLHGGESRTVTQIAETASVDISVVSRHLAMLRDAGILESERRGKEVYYRVRTGPLVDTLRTLADSLEACCPDLKVAQQPDAPQADTAKVAPPASSVPRVTVRRGTRPAQA